MLNDVIFWMNIDFNICNGFCFVLEFVLIMVMLGIFVIVNVICFEVKYSLDGIIYLLFNRI